MIKYICSILIGSLLISCGNTEGGPGGGSHPLQQEATATAYTVRLPGSNPEEQAILLTQTVYPATREDNAVGAIILVPQDEQIAFTAMHRITHMPVNAPMLYLSQDNTVSEQTLREMKRLKPDGVLQDERTDVYAVNVPAKEVEKVREILGYRVRTFYEEDPIQLASVLDRWQAALKADHPDEVIISAIDHPKGIEHGIGAMGWNAHMGKGFAWVYKDSIPQATKDILERRYGDFGAFMYLTGGSDVISDKVAKQLGRYGLVRRIAGKNVFASNSVNAGYKDFGRNWGWWWDWSPRSLGWGIAQAGHNYIIGNPDDMLYMIPAAVLGHMGKHGPILLVKPDSVPKPTADYLKMVKPFKTGPQETILNFAWIIGDTTSVSTATQQSVDRLLSPFDIPVDTTAYLPKAPILQEKKD
ncbi:hypothetical protein [Christiangramia fulva]|uniref:hypothetical protein n=1 Tax=Christiangramia fulva TaxID=2126553 RepID=UPI00131CBBF8|nr:hypothetical protein [Christiangramia fulva]